MNSRKNIGRALLVVAIVALTLGVIFFINQQREDTVTPPDTNETTQGPTPAHSCDGESFTLGEMGRATLGTYEEGPEAGLVLTMADRGGERAFVTATLRGNGGPSERIYDFYGDYLFELNVPQSFEDLGTLTLIAVADRHAKFCLEPVDSFSAGEHFQG